MDSSISPKDEIWCLRVCYHILNAVYVLHTTHCTSCCLTRGYNPIAQLHNVSYSQSLLWMFSVRFELALWISSAFFKHGGPVPESLRVVQLSEDFCTAGCILVFGRILRCSLYLRDREVPVLLVVSSWSEVLVLRVVSLWWGYPLRLTAIPKNVYQHQNNKARNEWHIIRYCFSEAINTRT
jgi:hypothetical protein